VLLERLRQIFRNEISSLRRMIGSLTSQACFDVKSFLVKATTTRRRFRCRDVKAEEA